MYYSRPELVPDDKGRVLPVVTDEYLSVALLDSVNNAMKGIATWEYVGRLLGMVQGLTDKVKRPLILQELTNVCHMEYRRAQGIFKRRLSLAPGFASKRFRRTPNPNNHTQWKITMKGRPEDSTVTDPQLHYVLRLCHPDTSPAAAVQWIQKLDDHNARHPQDGKRMHENQITAFGDLTIIVSFMHSMSTSIAATPISRKSGLLYVSRMTDLDTEIDHQKAQADFGDFLVPMGNLLEPDMSARALAALDDFIVDTTGARLGSLYEDIIQDSLDDLESMYAKAKAKLEHADKKTTYVPFAAKATSSTDDRVQRRKEKEKTRPLGAIYDITAAPHPPEIILTEPPQQIKVNASTAAVFATLFSRGEARGSVAWTDFEAALADLGFSVTPKGGSIYTFNPPESMSASPITLHRPHASEIEGYKLLIFARRLSRVYGWNAQTFEIA
ncbi:hypothetical protein LTR33_003818 [Friedmanniomyces endolithicus]|nr:hypothetical protein LTR33_003818 [Friedmanniomyces endolithicus]